LATGFFVAGCSSSSSSSTGAALALFLGAAGAFAFLSAGFVLAAVGDLAFDAGFFFTALGDFGLALALRVTGAMMMDELCGGLWRQ